MSIILITTRSLCHGNEHPRPPRRHRSRGLPEAIGPVGHRRCKAARHRAPDAFQSRQREGVGFDRDGLSSIEGIRLHPRNVARHAAGLRPCAVSSFGNHDSMSNELLPRRLFPSATRRSGADDSRIHEFRGRVTAFATGTESGRALARSCPRAQCDHGMRCTKSSSAFLVVPRYRLFMASQRHVCSPRSERSAMICRDAARA